MKFKIPLLCLLFTIFSAQLFAESDVKLSDQTLFSIESHSGDLSPRERAKRANEQIESLFVDIEFPAESIKVVEKDNIFYIEGDNRTIIGVTINDTTNTGFSQNVIADLWAKRIRDAIIANRERSTSLKSLIRTLLLVLSPVFLVLIYLLINKISMAISRMVMKQEGKLVKGIKFGRLQIVSSSKEIQIILKIIQVLKFLTFGLIVWVAILVFLNQFEQTSDFVETLQDKTVKYFELATPHIATIIQVIIGAIILFIVMRILLWIINFFMGHYKDLPSISNNLTESGYSAILSALRRLVILLFLLSVIYIIPGGKLISLIIFVIVLFIMGLSCVSLIRDFMAGYILMIRGLFQNGDHIQSGDMSGEVVDRNFLFTELRDSDGSNIILHNSLILSKPLIVSKAKVKKNEETLEKGADNGGEKV